MRKLSVLSLIVLAEYPYEICFLLEKFVKKFILTIALHVP